MTVFQTAGLPPSDGRTSRPTMGWTAKSSAAERNIEMTKTAARIELREMPDNVTGAIRATVGDDAPASREQSK
ncbi:MAG: hypothetical protein Phyf2KO_15490 [Phycisphaerales bacterium]